MFLVDNGIAGAYLLALLFVGGSTAFKQLALTLSPDRLIVVGTYFLLLYLVYCVVLFPLSVYGGFVVPRRFGLLTQGLSSWLLDWGKGTGIGAFLGLILIEILYYSLAVVPDYWWLAMGAIVLFFTVVLANLAPIILVPLFYKLTPLEDEALTRRLIDLAARSRTVVRGV